jgi:acetyl-CoA synthetase
MTVESRQSKLARLIVPRSICLIGAGDWTDAVAAGSRKIGYTGELWRVHPKRAPDSTTHYYRSIEELPAAPDATFLAVPKQEAPAVAAALARRGAGGFVCFAAGFSEVGDEAGRQLTDALVRGAGDLPFFGPNCYGTVNFFDRVALWPDQVVGDPPQRGVALICQSGTIALTLMFNDRSLPIGYIFTVGNQTNLAVEDLIELLCEDSRVSAFGLYLEGIKDARAFATAADKARRAGKPIAMIKAGRTEAAARTAQSHTGALAGADSIFDTFCRQTGIARCDTLSTLCETLKLFHAGGPLKGRRVLIMGASGGDMAMTADVSRNLPLEFPAIEPCTADAMTAILTDRVTIANPLDIHTYLWFDPPQLSKMFAIAMRAGFDAVGFMLDNPPESKADTASFAAVIDGFIAAARGAPTRAALISSLPETISPGTRQRCLSQGVVPLQGQREALEALSMAGSTGEAWGRPGNAPGVRLRLPARAFEGAHLKALAYTLTEHAGKTALAEHGMPTARRIIVAAGTAGAAASAADQIGYPVVMKAYGAHLEHKSDVGGVILNLQNAKQVEAAVERLSQLSGQVLVEQMITDGVAEVLAGIIVDPQFGQTLVVGAGGVLTELLKDSVSLLPPWDESAIEAAIDRLTVSKLLNGFRGKPRGDRAALVAAVMAVARYAEANLNTLLEIDVNPIIVRPEGLGAVAVDALIRLTKEP